MAVSQRKPTEIVFRFNPDGTIPSVQLHAILTDADEGTVNGASRDFAQPGVIARAQALYDQIALLAANAGKQLTF